MEIKVPVIYYSATGNFGNLVARPKQFPDTTVPLWGAGERETEGVAS